MRYIVYIEGNNYGYFVGYKDKLSNEYSLNFREAKRYKNIGSAIGRLGLEMRFNSIEQFIELNCSPQNLIAFKRDRILGEFFDEQTDFSALTFRKGHINIIDNEGNMYNGIAEVIRYAITKPRSLTKRSEFVDLADNDFWNEYLKQ